MANHNGARFVQAAIESALAQRDVEVEVIVVDDCSSDESWSVLQQLAASEPRLRPYRLAENRGPAGARNLAITEARGDWLAILDSDDLLHPDRSHRLVHAALQAGANMVADNLLVFDDGRSEAAHLHLNAARRRSAQWLCLETYLSETRMYGRRPNLGFLKPMFRLDFVRASRLGYDERLRIAEDDDLVLRALAAGGRYWLVPEPMYFYRKHGSSISHRLSPANADRMIEAAARQELLLAEAGRGVAAAWRARSRALQRARDFSWFIDALKRRDAAAAARAGMRNPSALLLLRQPLAALFQRRLARFRRVPPGRPTQDDAVLFISRQRLIGATNGSSAYLLGLAAEARVAGLVPHLIQPSPGMFGRIPFFRLRPEMRVFETIRVRGGVRLGDWLVTVRPDIFVAAARGILARMLRRAGMGGQWAAERSAPYAIAARWSGEDLCFVARHGRALGRIAIADYAFQTEALPYLLDADRPTAVVMHDLFSARSAQFEPGAADSVAALDEAAEIALLAKADAVIAIQEHEAGFVRAKVPQVRAILAPMAVRAVDAAQVGEADNLLFVGSNTAPNVHGLDWFLDHVWPVIVKAAPDTRLLVAGTVGAAVTAPAGVELLGLVDDLGELYAKAGVVISPLRQGSGLKIKLVEAVARGKACVVTSVTLQGVEAVLSDAVLCADEPQEFAESVLALLRDSGQRAMLADRALSAAHAHFGAHGALAAFRGWLAEARQENSVERSETPRADIVDLERGGKLGVGTGIAGPAAAHGEVGD